MAFVYTSKQIVEKHIYHWRQARLRRQELMTNLGGVLFGGRGNTKPALISLTNYQYYGYMDFGEAFIMAELTRIGRQLNWSLRDGGCVLDRGRVVRSSQP